MENLNEAFRRTLTEAIGESNADIAFEAFDSAPSVSVRLNPSRPQVSFDGVPVPWNPLGLMLSERPSFTMDPAFHAGAYYVQDSSAMFVGHVARQLISKKDRPLRVLDLCAAPGGKTTDLASSLRQICGDSFILVANEVMKQRAQILADNVGRWGDPNVVVTSVDPKAFSSLEGFFDMIVADVPCSGEGMFRKDDEAVRQWSEDNVALCEARQRRIVADVWPALSDQGTMVYSTCTFNRRENDGNVRWMMENLDAELIAVDAGFPGVYRTELGFSLVPGLVKGEGQYCAAVRKNGGSEPRLRQPKTAKGPSFSHLFDVPMNFVQKNDTVVAVPKVIAAEVEALEFLRPLMKGVAVGEVKGKDLVPHADLALVSVLAQGAFPQVDVDRKTALSFLHKDPIVLKDAPKGLIIVCHEGQRLGFVKNLGNRCNNLLPQGRRIRMDI